jgi:hypothetical protein
MKRILLAVYSVVATASVCGAFAAEEKMHMENNRHEMSMMDTRTSLGATPEMKQHHLMNMRAHVEAIASIVGLMAEKKFEDAAGVAHSMLGIRAEMQAMCGMFKNEKYEKLGLAFHKSADDLGDVLKTKDVNASLRALNKTLQYCVECHATYRH